MNSRKIENYSEVAKLSKVFSVTLTLQKVQKLKQTINLTVNQHNSTST